MKQTFLFIFFAMATIGCYKETDCGPTNQRCFYTSVDRNTCRLDGSFNVDTVYSPILDNCEKAQWVAETKAANAVTMERLKVNDPEGYAYYSAHPMEIVCDCIDNH